ncbi:hypothetical protein [Streptomyces griseorubiginosus]|uniref:hypothetical protein n=1 Tax=Streptomyces griseorubiginosus TaxID=67304 RepID=UPI0013C4766A|nr:hypothetical protein [Streptomyces griseorubiginosus]
MVVRVRKRVSALGFDAALGRLVEEGLVRFSSFVLRKDGDHKAVVPLPAGLAAVVVADQAVTVHGALFGVEGKSMSAVRTATFQLAFPRTPQAVVVLSPPRAHPTAAVHRTAPPRPR